MIATTEIPEDRAMPALARIHDVGLARAIPALRLGDGEVELTLRGFSPGLRATLEARAGGRRFAVKIYADDPSDEAGLYQSLALAGLAGGSGARVPPLLAWERELRVLVIGWLEGPTAQQLIENGQGQRAGELAATWFQRIARLPLKLGPPFGAPRMLHRGRKWAAKLALAEAQLGRAATALIETLAQTEPEERATHLVHGTFYARHLLDLGDGPGVIDWQRFAQGPLELDAGMFLATLWRLGRPQASLAAEAARAENSFIAGTSGLMDARSLAWHRAAALLRLAEKTAAHRGENWLARAGALLAEAARLAQAAG
ncbi:MAG: hypothetical protein EPO07_08010 [Verrucomicrobia bacterium]|nr:MAG: hypothetical protein EPO07_08010 [Verrucomicrobiota bacterium]